MKKYTGRDWSVTVTSEVVEICRGSEKRRLEGQQVEGIVLARRWLRWHLTVAGDPAVSGRLRGLSRYDALEMRWHVANHLRGWADRLAEVRRAEKASALRDRVAREIEPELRAATAWAGRVEQIFSTAVLELRWITHDEVEALVAARPRLRHLPRYAGASVLDGIVGPAETSAISAMSSDLQVRRARTNKEIERGILRTHRDFFDTIEKSPLSDEQARAVLCFDNRVQVIAAAGSGKTSVMVARAAYAVHRGLVPADRILLLAFNADAARELQARVDTRMRARGLPTDGLTAATFHSFGLSVIGKARGAKPRLASWLGTGADTQMVERLVDELRDTSPSFRYRWDLYRLVFARSGDSPEGAEPGWWDPTTKVSGHRTANGETVRSTGEKMIADWLYYNGVRYEYESPYHHDVADAEHSQYRPDFYYPDLDVWHEHWALDHAGNPPPTFVGYAEGMRWKRDVHRRFGTTLIETTWAGIVDRTGFEGLESALRARGVELDWDPGRPTTGAPEVTHGEMARLMRSFMTHVKANSFSRDDLEKRARTRGTHLDRYRTGLFLDLYWAVHDAWQARLAADGAIDFEDMLVGAAEALEGGAEPPAYDLVLVDEFQDSSAARARLVKALVRHDGSYLMAVGDDWQSINRFAGADLDLMTRFEEWFGPSDVRRLQTTFRSTQAITDAAARFVSANPRQIAKTVRSAHGPGGAPVALATVTAAERNRPEPEIRSAVDAYLRRIAAMVESGEVPTGASGRVSVDVLGRYRSERDLLPQRFPDRLDVTFRTIHGSKGLEADYVLIPRAIAGARGFPSGIEDDPVLDLVMSDPDPFPFGEERRLLYVALTRARREAALITVAGNESPFVVELLKNGLVVAFGGSTGSRAASLVCPACDQGMLILRSGRAGPFWSCGRFPACLHKQNQPPT